MSFEDLMAAAIGFDVLRTGACVHSFEMDVVLTYHNHNVLRAVDGLNRKSTGENAVAQAIKFDEFSDDGRAR